MRTCGLTPSRCARVYIGSQVDVYISLFLMHLFSEARKIALLAGGRQNMFFGGALTDPDIDHKRLARFFHCRRPARWHPQIRIGAQDVPWRSFAHRNSKE